MREEIIITIKKSCNECIQFNISVDSDYEDMKEVFKTILIYLGYHENSFSEILNHETR